MSELASESREVQALKAFVAASGVPHKVTATLGRYINPTNPCAPHSPGSFHCKPGTDGTGLAIDLAGPAPSWNSPQLLAIFAAFGSVESSLAELVYSGAPYSIKNGRRVPRYAVAAHWNHVHVAVPRGTFLPAPASPVAPPATKDAIVINAAPIALLTHPAWGKGYTIVTADGGVFNFKGSPFFGSLGAVQLNKPIIDASVTASGQGYMMLGADGGVFCFGDAEFDGAVQFNG